MTLIAGRIKWLTAGLAINIINYFNLIFLYYCDIISILNIFHVLKIEANHI